MNNITQQDPQFDWSLMVSIRHFVRFVFAQEKFSGSVGLSSGLDGFFDCFSNFRISAEDIIRMSSILTPSFVLAINFRSTSFSL